MKKHFVLTISLLSSLIRLLIFIAETVSNLHSLIYIRQIFDTKKITSVKLQMHLRSS